MSTVIDSESPFRQLKRRPFWLWRIGVAQRLITGAIVAQIVMIVLSGVASMVQEPLLYALATLLVFIPLTLYTIVATTVMLYSMKSHVLAWLLAALAVLNVLLCLPMLYWLHKRAADYLELNGVQAGFWGASLKQLRHPELPPGDAPGVVTGHCPHCGIETAASSIFTGFRSRCRECGKRFTFQPNPGDDRGFKLQRYDETRTLWNYLWRWHHKQFTEQERQRVESGQFDEGFMQQTCSRILNTAGHEVEVTRCTSCNCIAGSPMASVCRWCGHSD